jgi:hypothetical protein
MISGRGDWCPDRAKSLNAMWSVDIAAALRGMQAYGQAKLNQSGHRMEDVPAFVRRFPRRSCGDVK